MKIDLDRVRAMLTGRPHRAASTGDSGSAEGAADTVAALAAVAAVLRQREEAGDVEVLLIRRALHDRDPWSGHMAFPGGRHDPSDADLLGTAIRETQEEVGLRLVPGEHLVGRLDDLPVLARGRPVGLVVAPFVFAIQGDPVLAPNAMEVQELVWAPLGPLARGERNTSYGYELEGVRYPLPAFDVDGRIVWGLTHRMLQALFEALDGAPRGGYAR